MKRLAAAAAAALVSGAVAGGAAATDKVLYQDDHIRFVEVTNRPGADPQPAIPYRSVVLGDSVWPKLSDPKAAAPTSARMLPPDNRPYPFCFVEGPQPARTVVVQAASPQHYYRIDYKRIDGKAYGANWSKWYADVFGPPKKVVADPGRNLVAGKPYSKEWPYDLRYSAITSAPANHTLRYSDDHIEFIEVAIRIGETEHMHGHPYPSVYADDGGAAPEGSVYKNARLDPKSGPPMGKRSGDPTKGPFPICYSAVPETPHQVTVVKGPPQHFYRVHFKRIDGGGAAN